MNMYSEINTMVRNAEYEGFCEGVTFLLDAVYIDVWLKGLISMEAWREIENIATKIKEI